MIERRMDRRGFLAAGCAAVGAGATLIARQVWVEKDWKGLAAAARKFTEAVDRARR